MSGEADTNAEPTLDQLLHEFASACADAAYEPYCPDDAVYNRIEVARAALSVRVREAERRVELQEATINSVDRALFGSIDVDRSRDDVEARIAELREAEQETKVLRETVAFYKDRSWHWHDRARAAEQREATLREQIARSEDAEERVARLRAAATDTRLRDAQTMGDLLDDARGALQEAWNELERAETHHRWHHEQERCEVEPDEERLRVLMVIAEALDSLGADDAALAGSGGATEKITLDPDAWLEWGRANLTPDEYERCKRAAGAHTRSGATHGD